MNIKFGAAGDQIKMTSSPYHFKLVFPYFNSVSSFVQKIIPIKLDNLEGIMQGELSKKNVDPNTKLLINQQIMQNLPARMSLIGTLFVTITKLIYLAYSFVSALNSFEKPYQNHLRHQL